MANKCGISGIFDFAFWISSEKGKYIQMTNRQLLASLDCSGAIKGKIKGPDPQISNPKSVRIQQCSLFDSVISMS